MSIKNQKGSTLIITLIIIFILGLLSAILLDYVVQENKLNISVRTSTLLMQDIESAVEYGVVWTSANYYPNIISETSTTLPNGHTAKIQVEQLNTSYMNGVAIVKLTILLPREANSTVDASHVAEAFVYVMTLVDENVGGVHVGINPSPYPVYLIRWRILR
ncbi:hypothetical protein GM182_01560 [bacterium 3DAC]|jgi:Tfp pilus assembly protein PilX|nr:hypothetical protein [Dictyoglomota bacterium]UZN22627.1 hypothetical protein GM182_01560 [bacterium 3DAC]